jgi:hypothetical protein
MREEHETSSPSGTEKDKFEVIIALFPSDSPSTVQVAINNLSDSSGIFYKTALLGLTVSGLNSTYNRNLRFEYVPKESVQISARGTYRFTFNLQDKLRPFPPPGQYTIIMRYEIEGQLYASNELNVQLTDPT